MARVHLTWRVCLKCRWVTAVVWEEPGDPQVVAGGLRDIPSTCGHDEFEYHDRVTVSKTLDEVLAAAMKMPVKVRVVQMAMGK